LKLTYLIILITLLLGPILTQPNLVTANFIARRCERYRPIVEYYTEDYPLDPDVVLAVMAAESACDPNIVSLDGHGSVGLMQVIPRSWTPSASDLKNPNVNIQTGMRLLYANLENSGMNPGRSLTTALAAYNCGWDSLNKGKCIPSGGYTYANKIVFFWAPIIRGELKSPLLE